MEFKNFADLKIGDVVYEYRYHNGDIKKETIGIKNDNIIIYRHINVEIDNHSIFGCRTSCFYDYDWVNNKLEPTEKPGLNLPIWFDSKYNTLYTTISDIDFVVNGLLELGKDRLRRELKKMLNIIDPEPNYADIRFK